jgi:hypothetical protein
MPEDMPDRMPEDMPDRMPDRMPEDMSDRMPEDLPVTKCINVMVGITRSKVIFSVSLPILLRLPRTTLAKSSRSEPSTLVVETLASGPVLVMGTRRTKQKRITGKQNMQKGISIHFSENNI